MPSRRQYNRVLPSLLSCALLASLASCRKEPLAPKLPSGTGPEVLLKVAPRDLPTVIRDRYRVQPDRRLLLAVGAVHQLSTGKDRGPVRAAFKGDHWEVSAGDQAVGALPEIPTFMDGTQLLVRWAKQLDGTVAPSHGEGEAVQAIGSEVDPERILAELASLNKTFGKHRDDPAVLSAATDGFVWLATIGIDRLEQADSLAGRAWALLALEKAVGSPRVTGHEALLASALGYQAAASQIGRGLGVEDPVRFYVTGEAGLGNVCSQHTEDHRCRFFQLALLATSGDSERFRRELGSAPVGDGKGLPSLALAVAGADFDQGPEPGRALSLWALASVHPSGLAWNLRSLAPREFALESQTKLFEKSAHSYALSLDGELLDAPSVEGFMRGVFYTGLYQEAVFISDSLASGPATRDFADGLADPAPGTAAELRRWAELRTQVLSGSGDLAPLAEAITTLRSVGVPPLERLRYTVGNQTVSTDPLKRSSVPAFFERLDTRPTHLLAASRAAWSNLTSPLLFEKYARAVVEAAPYSCAEIPASAALLDEDTGRLRTLVDDRAMPSVARQWALDGLGKLGKADHAFVRSHLEAMAAADPTSWALGALLTDFRQAGDLEGALAAVRDALRRHGPERDLVWAHLVTEEASILGDQGHLDSAFATLKPALDSWKEEVLEMGAVLELRRGHLEEALKLARSNLERYPENVDASALVVRTLWLKRDPASAAKELAENQNGLVRDWDTRLPTAFAEAYQGASEADIGNAVAEMNRAHLPPHILVNMVLELAKNGDLVPMALRLLTPLRDPAPALNTGMQVSIYEFVRERSGEDAALAWIRQVIPAPDQKLALILFQERKYGLLWGLYPAGSQGTNARVARLLKAASLLHLREMTSARRTALIAEIEADPAHDDEFVRGALFLLGQRDEDAVLRPLPDIASVAELGWVMGMKAASEGRFRDAEPWFQVALESQQQRQPPHAWSFIVLSNWLAEIRSLEVLQKKGTF